MRIGLLLGEDIPEFRMKTLEPILADPQFNIVFAIIDRRKKKSVKKKIIDNWKRGRGGYMLIMAVKKIFSASHNLGMNSELFCDKLNIYYHSTRTPYASETIKKIHSYDLDTLLLISGFGIVRKELLDITSNGVISYHHGNMREYRGMPPALWELYNNEKIMGVTVQKLLPGLDCGLPIQEITIDIRATDTVKSLTNRAIQLSVPMLHQALVKLNSHSIAPEPVSNLGPVYTLPNFKQWIILNVKIYSRILKNYFAK